MKYKEFREYLKRNEIPFQEDKEKLEIAYNVEISKTEEYSIMFLLGFIDSPYECEMLKIAIELAKTPLDEREEISSDTSRGTGGFGSTGRF